MIRIKVLLYPHGCLRATEAAGHAEAGGRGEDIVCAAVTVLLRTAAQTLAGLKELALEGQAGQEGQLSFSLPEPPADRREYVRGVTDCLVRGLEELSVEYPANIKLEVRKD